MSKFGGRNSRAAKLTIGQVREIRELYVASRASQGQLARDFGVSVVQIGRIVRGEVWQNLGPVAPTKEEMALSAQRMYELSEQIKNESPTDRMAREIFEAKKKLPDNMIDELSDLPEGDI